MAKKIKMVLYGEPGVGKSVFASNSPKPFFICTDGNYEWLVDFGAKEEDHIQVDSWEEAKKVFAQPFDDYDTIVVDLIEDLFKWSEQEFCKRNRIEHISDVNYGKGYDITRNAFFLEISKLLAKDKHVILISHGITSVVKDRRGVEHTIYSPSSRIPDKVWDMIEGRVRYFLRCYLQAEEVEGGDKEETKLVKKRYLSLIPKENEFGICRGIDEATTPHDIELDFNEFMKTVGLDTPIKKEITTTKEVHHKETKSTLSDEEFKEMDELVDTPKRRGRKPKEEVKEIEPSEETDENQMSFDDIPSTPEKVETSTKSTSYEAIFPIEKQDEALHKESVEESKKPLSREDKLAAIKAKLAASQNK